MTHFEDADGCRVFVGQFSNGAAWETRAPRTKFRDSELAYGFRYIDGIAFEVSDDSEEARS